MSFESYAKEVLAQIDKLDLIIEEVDYRGPQTFDDKIKIIGLIQGDAIQENLRRGVAEQVHLSKIMKDIAALLRGRL